VSAKRVLTVSMSAPAPGLLAWPQTIEGPADAPRRQTSPGRILVGGVGYTNLGDRSFGPLLIERLLKQAWPADVVIEDVSYGPIDVLFKLEAEPSRFRLGIFVSAVARSRPPGTVERREWYAETPSVDALQERIAEAVTGVVSLENLLYILQHFGMLPERTVVIEVEPEAEEAWGPDLSAPVLAAMAQVDAIIRQEISAAGAPPADEMEACDA
jgi:hydrogenase maturation protease